MHAKIVTADGETVTVEGVDNGVTTYTLIKQYGFSKGTLDSLKQGRNISTATLDDLCDILDCDVEEVLRHIPNEK